MSCRRPRSPARRTLCDEVAVNGVVGHKLSSWAIPSKAVQWPMGKACTILIRGPAHWGSITIVKGRPIMKTLVLASVLAVTGAVATSKPAEARWVTQCGPGYGYCYGSQYGYRNGRYTYYYAYRYGYCSSICRYVWK